MHNARKVRTVSNNSAGFNDRIVFGGVSAVRRARLPLALAGLTAALACSPGAQHTSAQAQSTPTPAQNTPAPVGTKPACTRSRVAQMMYAAFQTRLDPTPSARLPHDTPFTDVKQTDPAFRAIVVLNRQQVANGVVEDNLTYFHPNAIILRYDLAQALDRLLTALKPTGTASLLAEPLDMPRDIPVSAEAYASVEKMLKLGILKPYPDGYFRGVRPTTDAEVADALAAMKAFVGGKATKPSP